MKRFSSGGYYADITPTERAIANGQRSFVSFLLLQNSNSFLRILAVPNKAVFCNSPVLMVTPSFSSHASNLLLTTPIAPMTTSTTSSTGCTLVVARKRLDACLKKHGVTIRTGLLPKTFILLLLLLLLCSLLLLPWLLIIVEWRRGWANSWRHHWRTAQ